MTRTEESMAGMGVAGEGAEICVLFVCVGNICRSPTAEGVFRHLMLVHGLGARVAVESAGTTSYHVGEAPDARAQLAARQRGYDLAAIRSRRVTAGDFSRFDYVLAMDDGVYAELLRLCPVESRGRVQRFIDFCAGTLEREIPDPYYGRGDGFERVLDLVEMGCEGLLRACAQGLKNPCDGLY